MKIKNKILTLLLLTTTMMASSAFAWKSPIPPTGLFIPTPSYWRTCWAYVEVDEFTAGAMADMVSIETTHNMRYHVPVMQQDMDNSEAQIQNANNNGILLREAMADAYSMINSAALETGSTMLKKEMEYMKHLSEQAMNDQHTGFFEDENGADGKTLDKTAQSFKYFKSLCKRNKMFSKAASPDSQRNQAQTVSAETSKKTNQAASASNVVQNSALAVESHFQKFCNAEEVSSGLCSTTEIAECSAESGLCKGGEEFKLANGDVSGSTFLSPEGEKDRNEIVEELFKTNSTYSEDELEAATRFADNIVYANMPQAPTVAEKNNPAKSEFVAKYNESMASLNLAYSSFATSVNKRKPITDGKILMSEIDIYRYIMHDFTNPDNLTAILAGKENSYEVAKYSLLTLRNKLTLEKYLHSEKMETLIAALLVKESNSGLDAEYLRKLK